MPRRADSVSFCLAVKVWAMIAAAAPREVSGGFLPHTFVGYNFSNEHAPYSAMVYDSAWAPFGRVVILPMALRGTKKCEDTLYACHSCEVAFTPDPTVLYFDVPLDLDPNASIAINVLQASNVGAELLTPAATVYIPPRGCRPPLILSYGGAFVDECATPAIESFFRLTAGWCFTPSFSTHILRLDTLEWTHVAAPGGPPANMTNSSEHVVYGLGVALTYDSVRDAVVMTGGYDVFVGQNIPLFLATYALHLDGLCQSSTSIAPGSFNGTGYDRVTHNWNTELALETLEWDTIRPAGPFTSADNRLQASMALGVVVSDPETNRIVQYGGIDSSRIYPFADCNTFDLATRQWQQQPACTYVDTTGPYLTWDAASVVLPNRRQALLIGGRITAIDGSGVSWLVPADEHWAINLDTLSWRRLSADPMFWGLPQLSGARSVAVPYPDGSAGIFVWGGFTSNITSGISWRFFECGIAVRTEVAVSPFVYRSGSFSAVFFSRIPPFSNTDGLPRAVLDARTISILVTSLFALLLAVLPRMCHLLLRCCHSHTDVTMRDNHNDAPQLRLQGRSLVTDLLEPQMASANLWQSVNSSTASDQQRYRLPRELQLSSMRTQPSLSSTSEHVALPRFPLHADRVPRQVSLSASIDDRATSSELTRGIDPYDTSSRTLRRLDASIVGPQSWSATVARSTDMAWHTCATAAAATIAHICFTSILALTSLPIVRESSPILACAVTCVGVSAAGAGILTFSIVYARAIAIPSNDIRRKMQLCQSQMTWTLIASIPALMGAVLAMFIAPSSHSALVGSLPVIFIPLVSDALVALLLLFDEFWSRVGVSAFARMQSWGFQIAQILHQQLQEFPSQTSSALASDSVSAVPTMQREPLLQTVALSRRDMDDQREVA